MKKIQAWFRKNSATIGVVTVVLAAGTILFFQTLALSKLEASVNDQQKIISQIKDLTTSLDDHASDRTQQINQLNRHIDCIVLFFANSDRANKSISDIDTCTLKNNETGQTSNPLGNSGVLSPAQPKTESPKPTATPAPTPEPFNPIKPLTDLLKSIF